tara:strand:+ start:154 stop:636 length:483 start_codon:yes stop_codon:yes gene_type:complete
MFGLVTMLLTTLGATGMGSMLKIVGGIVQSANDAKEAKAKRELIRDMSMSNANADFQKSVFGEVDQDTSIFTRATRRLIALIGMLNFAAISIWCTIYPGIDLVTFTPPENKESWDILWGFISIPSGSDLTTSISTGHIALVAITTLGAIIGFYFTPGGKR